MSARVSILDEKFEPVAHRQHICFIIDNGRNPSKKAASKEETSLSLRHFNLRTLSISPSSMLDTYLPQELSLLQ